MPVVDGRDQRRGIGFSEQDYLLVRMKIKHDYPACALFRGGRCTCDEAAEPVDNPPMAKTVAERQKEFKESQAAAGMVRLEAWVTKEQREKFRALGGDAWLRKRIEKAAEPEDKK